MFLIAPNGVRIEGMARIVAHSSMDLYRKGGISFLPPAKLWIMAIVSCLISRGTKHSQLDS